VKKKKGGGKGLQAYGGTLGIHVISKLSKVCHTKEEEQIRNQPLPPTLTVVALTTPFTGADVEQNC
jgi:hypothetical protein